MDIFKLLFLIYIQTFMCHNPILYLCILQFEVKPDEVDKVCPNRLSKLEPVQKPKPKHVDHIDPPDMPETSA